MQEVLRNHNGNGHSLPPNQRKPREYTLNEEEIRDMIYNATTRDTRMLRKLMTEKRDYDNECDYPSELTVNDHYKPYFDYHAVATRTVEVLPLETWQVQPTVYEDDDPNVKTEFEKAWDELGSNLRGQSWHKKEEGSPVWEYLKRADILSGIGSFGVILLGFDDGQPLNTPIAMLAKEDEDEAETWDIEGDNESIPEGDGISSEEKGPTTNAQGSIDSQYDGSVFGTDKVPKLKEGTKRKLIFMRPFDETLVQVTRLETDVSSPRHNQPVMYRLTLIDPDFAKEHAISMNIACPEVHWTRILHIADNLTNSECFGVPRQQPVYRHLRNLYKLYGGAPEMYWRGAMNGLSFETHPQLGGDVDIDKDAFKDMIENFRNGLQRDLQTSGMTVKSIAPNVSDATPFIDSQITAICIKIGCPQRIFMGSERGELASSQDDSSWNDRLKHRQEMYVTPRIIIPFIDRMISTGVLPKPQGKIIEENLTEDDGQDQEVIDSSEDSLQEKSTGKPTANAFGKASNSLPNAKEGSNPGFTPKSSGNASKAMLGDSSGGDNVGTGAPVASAPKARVLPEKDSSPGYCIVWPDLDSMTEAQKATISLQKTQALMAFIAGNGESAMTLVDFYTKVLYMTDEEAIGVIQAVNQQIEDDERLTPDPEEARQEQLEMQGEQFDKELEAKKELAESGQGFQAEMFDKQSAADEKMAKLKPKGKPVANFNPNQSRDNEGRWSAGGGGDNTGITGPEAYETVLASQEAAYKKDPKKYEVPRIPMEKELLRDLGAYAPKDKKRHQRTPENEYFGSGYSVRINRELRQGQTEIHKELVNNFHKLSVPVPKNIIAHRVIAGKLEDVIGNKIKVGDVITDKGFVSTTTNEKYAKKFNPATITNMGFEGTKKPKTQTLTIEIPKGVKVLANKKSPEEHELLLGPGTRLKVISTNPPVLRVTK